MSFGGPLLFSFSRGMIFYRDGDVMPLNGWSPASRMAVSVRFSRKWLCPSWTPWSYLRCFSRNRCLQSGRVWRKPFQRAEWQNGIFPLSQTTTASPPSGIFELPDGNAGFSLRRQRNQESSRLPKAVQGRIQNSFPKQRTKEQNLHLHLFPLFCKKSPACPSFPRDRQNGSLEYQSACWPESRKFLTSESRQLRRGTNQNVQPFLLFNRFPSFAIAYMAAPEG